jgi:hypothetical protein
LAGWVYAASSRRQFRAPLNPARDRAELLAGGYRKKYVPAISRLDAFAREA